MANQFECPDGHKFSADATHRAFCPVCGKSAKRIYQPGEEPTEPPPTESPSVSDQPIEPPKHKVKRVKVPAKKKPPAEPPVVESSPARKIKIKKHKKAAPLVKKKVTTTRQRKHEKQDKEESASHWRTFKKFKIL